MSLIGLLSANTAFAGGGIYGSPLLVINSTVSGNAASLYGGGVNNDNVAIFNSTLSEDSAGQGRRGLQ